MADIDMSDGRNEYPVRGNTVTVLVPLKGAEYKYYEYTVSELEPGIYMREKLIRLALGQNNPTGWATG